MATSETMCLMNHLRINHSYEVRGRVHVEVRIIFELGTCWDEGHDEVKDRPTLRACLGETHTKGK